MARSYTVQVENEVGKPIAQAWCRAYNVTDMANPVQVEEEYTDGSGQATFTELPDDAPVDVLIIWGTTSLWKRNVLSSSGASIDTAVLNTHVQNTDLYAKGYRTGTSFPGTPGEGEMYVRTDL